MDNFAPPRVEQADKDFEQFVASACHDLHQSLRELRLRAEAAPDIQLEEPIQAIESVLDGMLEYAGACASNLPHSRVEMRNVLDQVLVHLDQQVQESGAIVTNDPLPAVMGDAGQIAAILRHLFKNVLKFRGQTPPAIHLFAQRMGLHWVFGVRDNGPGIEEAYQERVFLPFKRLHGRDYAGNGLGLAICRKLIEKHDGKIWVESKPGDGTTILFSLPSAS